MIEHDLLAQDLVPGQQQSGRIAPCVRLLHQFEIGNNVLIIGRDGVKFLKQVERDMRLPVPHLLPQRCEFIAQTQWSDIMAQLAKRTDNVIFSLEIERFPLTHAADVLRWNQVFVRKNQDPEFPHTATLKCPLCR